MTRKEALVVLDTYATLLELHTFNPVDVVVKGQIFTVETILMKLGLGWKELRLKKAQNAELHN